MTTQFFKSEAEATIFTDQLLKLLTDTYYTYSEETQYQGTVEHCVNKRGYRAIPAKAEEIFQGQSLSYAKKTMSECHRWRNLSHHRFEAAAESLGFTVRRFANMTVITL